MTLRQFVEQHCIPDHCRDPATRSAEEGTGDDITQKVVIRANETRTDQKTRGEVKPPEVRIPNPQH